MILVETWKKIRKEKSFKHLLLEVLDISFNKISSLHRLLLKNSSNLMYINASNNRMSTWIVDINHMYNLTFLDLSENKFASLGINARFPIEKAFQNSINMTVDLSGNAFNLCM